MTETATGSPTPKGWPPGYTEHWVDHGHGDCYWEREGATGTAHVDAEECRLAAHAHYRTTRECEKAYEVERLKRELEDWKLGSSVEAAEADKGRKKVANLEQKLSRQADKFETLLHEAAYSACVCDAHSCPACKVVAFMHQDEEHRYVPR